MIVSIKIKKEKASMGGRRDPFGRDFIYFACAKNGIHEIGDTPLDAATKAIRKLEEAGNL